MSDIETSQFARSRFLFALIIIMMGLILLPAHAQTVVNGNRALATLDVCENRATGQWVYSGLVSVPGVAAGSAVKVDYMVQNKLDSTGYKTSFRGAAPSIAGALSPVYGFSVEAPALTLGTMRGAAKVQLVDISNPMRVATFEVVTAEAVCGCAPIKGCVRTQGYWGSKPDIVWPSPYSRDALFFASGLTLQQVLDRPAKGSGYVILAKQYVAAVLNYAASASAPSSVINAINQASTFFSGGTTPASCAPGECQEQIALAAILDTYNNGNYPGAPKHCPD